VVRRRDCRRGLRFFPLLHDLSLHSRDTFLLKFVPIFLPSYPRQSSRFRVKKCPVEFSAEVRIVNDLLPIILWPFSEEPDTFRWTHIDGDDVLVAKEDAEWASYMPSMVPALFRNFAALDLTPDAVLAFAQRYGRLGITHTYRVGGSPVRGE